MREDGKGRAPGRSESLVRRTTESARRNAMRRRNEELRRRETARKRSERLRRIRRRDAER